MPHVWLSFLQVLLNVRVRERKDIATLPNVSQVIKDCEKRLEDKGGCW